MTELPKPQAPIHKGQLARQLEEEAGRLGKEAAASHPPPGAATPTPQETAFVAASNIGLLGFDRTVTNDEAALQTFIDAGERVSSDQADGVTSSVPESYPRRLPVLPLIGGALIVGVFVFEILFAEPAWRDYRGLSDHGQVFERFVFPGLLAMMIAVLAYFSASAADRAATGSPTKRRLAVRHSVTWAVLILVPVFLIAAIRSAGEAKQYESTGMPIDPNAGVMFFVVQLAVGSATLIVSHLRHHWIRSALASRHDRYQKETLDLADEAESALDDYRSKEVPQLREELRQSLVFSWMILRTTLEQNTEDPAAAAAWGERNRRDFHALGLRIEAGGDRGLNHEIIDIDQVQAVIGGGDRQDPAPDVAANTAEADNAGANDLAHDLLVPLGTYRAPEAAGPVPDSTDGDGPDREPDEDPEDVVSIFDDLINPPADH